MNGLILSSDDASIRPRFTADEIKTFLPERGPFIFPEPYNTQGIRLTNPSDGIIQPVGYSYWNNINNHVNDTIILIFIGRVNQLPLLYAIEKSTLKVAIIRELPLNGTAERWYFSKVRPYMLYAELVDSKLLRLEVYSDNPTIVFDLADHGYPNHILWQSNTSFNDNVHSATLKSPDYQPLGAVVYRESDGWFKFFPSQGGYDECQIDKSGRWLIIKEGDYNKIIDLETEQETIILNEAGAVGHSDCGFGYMIGEDDVASQPGAEHLWGFAPDGIGVRDGGIVYHTTDWAAMGRHVSHCNAKSRENWEGNSIIVSSACRQNVPRSNEIIEVQLDGNQMCRVIAPNLVDLDSGGGKDDYENLPKANIDPPGEWIIWTANCGTDRLDAFLVKL